MTPEEALEVIQMVAGTLQAGDLLDEKWARQIKLASLLAKQGSTKGAIDKLHKIVDQIVDTRINEGKITHRQVLLNRLTLALGLPQ